MQQTSSRFRLYALPFVLGSCLGIGLYFVLQESGMLATSIGGAPTTQARVSDVHLTTAANQEIALVASKDLPAFTSLQMVLSFDPEAVTIHADDIHTSYAHQVVPSFSGQFVITLENTTPISANSTIITIAALGDTEQCTISDLVATLTDGTTTPLVLETE